MTGWKLGSSTTGWKLGSFGCSLVPLVRHSIGIDLASSLFDKRLDSTIAGNYVGFPSKPVTSSIDG